MYILKQTSTYIIIRLTFCNAFTTVFNSFIYMTGSGNNYNKTEMKISTYVNDIKCFFYLLKIIKIVKMYRLRINRIYIYEFHYY